MNNKKEFDIKWHLSKKHPFDTWMAKNLKDNIRIIDEHECRSAWNSAISAAIRTVNKSNDFDVVNNLKGLKHSNYEQ